jgi:hypothetical protein
MSNLKNQLKSKLMEFKNEFGTYSTNSTADFEPIRFEDKPQDNNNESALKDIVKAVMASKIQSKVFHWQVTGVGSYANHKTLDKYYDSVGEYLDSLVEAYLGGDVYLNNFGTIPLVDFKNDDHLSEYFGDLLSFICDKRNHIKEPYLQNIVDEICALISVTKYRLKTY